MDFKGQQLAELLGLWIVSVAAAIAFVLGWAMHSFPLMAQVQLVRPLCRSRMHVQTLACMSQVFGGGCVAASALCIPDWPLFNRNPPQWLPPRRGEAPVDSGGGGVLGDTLGGLVSTFTGGKHKR